MAFSRLIDAIELGTGKFDNDKSYFINNSSNEDIIVTWALKEPEARGHGTYEIRAGEKGGPYPQFLAYHIVKALVSREMQKDGKSKFFGSAEMRAPYEDKYLIEIEKGGGEDPYTASIREQERSKLLAEMRKEGTVQNTVDDKPKRGRPKKEETQEFEGANRE